MVGKRDSTNLSKPSTQLSTQNWEGGREGERETEKK